MPSLRLPDSRLSRNRFSFCRRVLRVPRSGGWVGPVYKPGQLVDGDWQKAVVLEYVGSLATKRDRQASELAILWRYDGAEWREIGRSLGQPGSWPHALAEMARTALGPPTVATWREAAARISQIIDREIAAIDDPDQIHRLCAHLEDLVLCRLVHHSSQGRFDSGPASFSSMIPGSRQSPL
jgi:hypothetical protein